MTSRALTFALLFLAAPAAACAALFGDDPRPVISAAQAGFDPAFSPDDSVGALVAQAIGEAKKSVRVAARLFTSKPVSEALFKARRAGLDVEVILDRSNSHNGYSAAGFLLRMSQPPHMPRDGNGVYEEYVIIDESDVIVGNIADLTDREDERKNAVGVLFIRNAPGLAKRYLARWQVLWDASEEMKLEKGE